jgi:hypothetical protein
MICESDKFVLLTTGSNYFVNKKCLDKIRSKYREKVGKDMPNSFVLRKTSNCYPLFVYAVHSRERYSFSHEELKEIQFKDVFSVDNIIIVENPDFRKLSESMRLYGGDVSFEYTAPVNIEDKNNYVYMTDGKITLKVSVETWDKLEKHLVVHYGKYNTEIPIKCLLSKDVNEIGEYYENSNLKITSLFADVNNENIPETKYEDFFIFGCVSLWCGNLKEGIRQLKEIKNYYSLSGSPVNQCDIFNAGFKV